MWNQETQNHGSNAAFYMARPWMGLELVYRASYLFPRGVLRSSSAGLLTSFLRGVVRGDGQICALVYE